MNIAQMADTNKLNTQTLMSNMLNSQNQTSMNAYQQGGQSMQNLGMGTMSPYNVPWDQMNQYANVMGQPTVLGSGTQTSKSSGGGKSGGIGF